MVKMSPLTECNDQDLDKCYVQLGYDGACCWQFDVIQGNDNPNATEQMFIQAYKAAGYPVETNKSVALCMDAQFVNERYNNTEQTWVMNSTGVTYSYGYCITCSAVQNILKDGHTLSLALLILVF